MHTQIESNNLRLLTHPVVISLLHYKWKKFGLPLYLLNLFIFVLFLFFITGFSLSVPSPLYEDCKLI